MPGATFQQIAENETWEVATRVCQSSTCSEAGEADGILIRWHLCIFHCYIVAVYLYLPIFTLTVCISVACSYFTLVHVMRCRLRSSTHAFQLRMGGVSSYYLVGLHFNSVR